MKPRNKFENHIVELSKSLPNPTKAQEKWAYKHCLEHVGRRLKSGKITCLECAHQWSDKNAKRAVCPNCGTELKIVETRQQIFRQEEHFAVVTVCGGYQVVRFFYLRAYSKVGKKADYFMREAMQRWVAPNGRTAFISRLMTGMYYSSSWNFGSDLEIRNERNYHSIIPVRTYPHKRIIPELKRCGYSGNSYEICHHTIMNLLLTDNRIETLYKLREIALLRYFAYTGNGKIENYWASIRICLRNNYHIYDATMWCDYVDLLRFFGKDLHSPKYVCPADLEAEHNRYVAKKRRYRELEQLEEKKRKALEDETFFNEQKSPFFGLEFSDGELAVRVLESVTEIMDEGDAMHHCVFQSDYHRRENSLILSARIDGKRIETVEVSLSALKVVQSQGVCNKPTKHHDRIINLVNRNMKKISKHIAV